MRVKIEFEGNEEETSFIDFENLFVAIENVLKHHFDEVLYSNDGFVCRNTEKGPVTERQKQE